MNIILFSLTIHSVNEKFERNDFVLCAIPMDESKHSGENIALLLEQNLTANGFSMEKLISVVRDDAKNMQKTAKLLEKSR